MEHDVDPPGKDEKNEHLFLPARNSEIGRCEKKRVHVWAKYIHGSFLRSYLHCSFTRADSTLASGVHEDQMGTISMVGVIRVIDG